MRAAALVIVLALAALYGWRQERARAETGEMIRRVAQARAAQSPGPAVSEVVEGGRRIEIREDVFAFASLPEGAPVPQVTVVQHVVRARILDATRVQYQAVRLDLVLGTDAPPVPDSEAVPPVHMEGP